jgi:hypothetical protein
MLLCRPNPGQQGIERGRRLESRTGRAKTAREPPDGAMESRFGRRRGFGVSIALLP